MGKPQLFDVDENGQVQDPNVQTDNPELEDDPTLEAEQQQDQAEPEPQTETEVESQQDDIPEKYRGKTPAELIRMHQEAEKFASRQGNEVGELRKVVDDFIMSQTVARKDEAEPTEISSDPVDFFTDPEAAIQRAIDNHPKMRQAEQAGQALSKSAAMAELRNRHPDFESVVANPEFQEWVTSKQGLKDLFIKADQRFDVGAGDTLLSLWKERTQAAQTSAKLDQEARKTTAKAASTGNTPSSNPGEPRKRRFRRTDLIKLQMQDPDRYMDMQDEIMQAYAEKRVY